MSFQSILFPGGKDVSSAPQQPDFFSDLNLDQVVRAVTAGKEEYELAPLFYAPPQTVDAVLFRQEVLRDLEDAANMRVFHSFAKSMQATRASLAKTGKRYNTQQKMRWLVDTVLLYGDAIMRFSENLKGADVTSRGLRAFREYLSIYAVSEHFGALIGEARTLIAELSAIRYDILIQGLLVEVRPHADQSDYGNEVAALFDRFDREGAKDYAFEFGSSDDVNSIEGNILRLVAQTHEREFARLANFCHTNADFLDTVVVRFDREIQFYIAYLDHIAHLRELGLPFCYPRVSVDDKSVLARDTFDLALAGKLAAETKTPVLNDFRLEGAERILVVTGPNQGGKTTFSRSFAQLHYLAGLGYPVPGSTASLYLPDRIFTHFERSEHMTSLTGKLQDDLIRIHHILERATPRSIIIINEIFASTTLQDAVSLSRKIAMKIAELDLLCVWVTFIDEISTLNEKTVSMVSAVARDAPEQRTFKIEKRRADGLAYAQSLARKYRLTHELLLSRIRP